MDHTKTFVVSKFTNPSGEIVYRVSGMQGGTRIRKNFSTRTEAESERQALEIQRFQAEAGVRTTITRLTDDQLHQAESVFQRLGERAKPLSFYVDFALANYRAPDQQKPLVDAITEYVASKQQAFDQGQLSPSQMARIQWDLKQLDAHFPKKSVADLTVPTLVAFLEHGRPALKTYNNRRGIVGTFLKFSFVRGWIAENPIQRIPAHRLRLRRGAAQTLSVTQARAFMEFIEGHDGGRWAPYYALCLFAGIRPGVPGGEISKLRPEAVHIEEGEIIISAEVSKIREPRKVEIQPNLAAWLRAYPLDKHPIIVGDFKKRRERFAKKFNLTHDVMRHTFISMIVAKYRSFGEAALQAGNSESIIRRHYFDLKSRAEAEEFFSILPKGQAPAAAEAPVIPAPAPAKSAA